MQAVTILCRPLIIKHFFSIMFTVLQLALQFFISAITVFIHLFLRFLPLYLKNLEQFLIVHSCCVSKTSNTQYLGLSIRLCFYLLPHYFSNSLFSSFAVLFLLNFISLNCTLPLTSMFLSYVLILT